MAPKNHASLRRWVDLQTYTFIAPPPSEGLPATNFSANPTQGYLSHVHPIALLQGNPEANIACIANFVVDYPESDLSTIRLSTSEMIQLYDCMAGLVRGDRFNYLEPEVFEQRYLIKYNYFIFLTLCSKKFVDRDFCVRYEAALLKEFGNLTPKKKQKISSKISGKMPRSYSASHINGNLLHLISHLSHRNMLPAIAFSDNLGIIIIASGILVLIFAISTCGRCS